MFRSRSEQVNLCFKTLHGRVGGLDELLQFGGHLRVKSLALFLQLPNHTLHLKVEFLRILGPCEASVQDGFAPLHFVLELFDKRLEHEVVAQFHWIYDTPELPLD